MRGSDAGSTDGVGAGGVETEREKGKARPYRHTSNALFCSIAPVPMTDDGHSVGNVAPAVYLPHAWI